MVISIGLEHKARISLDITRAVSLVLVFVYVNFKLTDFDLSKNSTSLICSLKPKGFTLRYAALIRPEYKVIFR